ncbi:hypothetical protein QBC38DRAFT_362766 [Podospora fimiseda]|uniref:SMP-30/Gluconolactonase/LRE-like region domain-containing protein n=1 Tax=Podospora fimiseda TaxID=252190 RepID=A0AAN7BQV2_9PEZI|nr:hypothetical protein QBC38DRAFT_362766 [Podospora fimiseda]
MNSLLALGLLASSSLAGPPRPPRFTATEIFSFTPSNPIFIENLLVLPDNRILVPHFGGPGPDSPLYIVNQTSGTASIIATLPDSTAQTGVAALGNNKYVVTTGVVGANFEFINGSAAAHVLSILPGASTATILDTIPVPNTINLNGLVAVPAASGPPNAERHILLSADSRGGRVLKINTVTRTSSLAFTDPLLGGNPNIPTSIGITGVNGLNWRDRGKDGWLYFTNSAQGTYGRLKVNRQGDKVGNVEIISNIATPPGQENFFDDLAITKRGEAYVTWQTDKLIKVDRNGGQTIILGPSVVGGVVLRYPVAAKLGNSERELYVATGGIDSTGNPLGGQIVKIII